jgi:hypothetical protein
MEFRTFGIPHPGLTAVRRGQGNGAPLLPAPIATPDQIILVLGDFRGDVWLMDWSSPGA